MDNDTTLPVRNCLIRSFVGFCTPPSSTIRQRSWTDIDLDQNQPAKQEQVMNRKARPDKLIERIKLSAALDVDLPPWC